VHPVAAMREFGVPVVLYHLVFRPVHPVHGQFFQSEMSEVVQLFLIVSVVLSLRHEYDVDDRRELSGECLSKSGLSDCYVLIVRLPVFDECLVKRKRLTLISLLTLFKAQDHYLKRLFGQTEFVLSEH